MLHPVVPLTVSRRLLSRFRSSLLGVVAIVAGSESVGRPSGVYIGSHRSPFGEVSLFGFQGSCLSDSMILWYQSCCQVLFLIFFFVFVLCFVLCVVVSFD